MRQRRAVDPIAEQEVLLLAAINANNKEYLELYAKYFGSSADPRDIVMTELDGLGCTVAYSEMEEDAFVKKDIRIQFDTPVTDMGKLEPRLFALAKEAIAAIGIKPDTSYIAPGAKIKSLYTFPPIPILGLTLALWTFLIYHSGIALLSFSAQERFLTIVSPATGTTLFFAILVIHVAEAVAALVACSWAEMPPKATAQFVVTVFFVGVPWFRECLRAAYHRRRELDDSETLKIR